MKLTTGKNGSRAIRTPEGSLILIVLNTTGERDEEAEAWWTERIFNCLELCKDVPNEKITEYGDLHCIYQMGKDEVLTQLAEEAAGLDW